MEDMRTFEEWLLDEYAIDDFKEYKEQYDYDGTMHRTFFKEYLSREIE